MKNKGNMTPLKEYNNFPATDPKEIKTLILPGNVLRKLSELQEETKQNKTKQENNPLKSEKQHMNKTCLIKKQK